MSLSVEVVRDLGDKPAPNAIVSRFFADELVFGQIGRVAIDKSTEGLKIVTITLPGMRTHVRPGQLLQIDDIDAHHRGRVQSIQYSVGRSAEGEPFAVCSLSLRLMRLP
jgi:hypothetical protein